MLEATTSKPTASSPTPSIEELEAKVEEAAHELDDLVGQLRDARSQIARADKRFAELNEERKVLAPKTFGGDSKAKLELEGLEDEHDELARATRVARAAEPELERMVEEAKERLAHARREVHKARASEIYRQMESLTPERDRLADQLAGILAQQHRLYAEFGESLRKYDEDGANSVALDRGWRGNWLRKRFARFLG